jgi:hypothetical protein
MCAVRGAAGPSAALPHSFREMNVAVPKAGNDGLSGAIDDACIRRNLNIACAANCADGATGNEDNGILQRRGVRRRVDPASHKREGLRDCGDAGGDRGAAQDKEKRGAEPIPDQRGQSLHGGSQSAEEGRSRTLRYSVRPCFDFSCAPREDIGRGA